MCQHAALRCPHPSVAGRYFWNESGPYRGHLSFRPGDGGTLPLPGLYALDLVPRHR